MGRTSCQSIVVAGMVAGEPNQGGATWAVMQYVLGLRALGHDVMVIDPVPEGIPCASVTSYFDLVRTRFGLDERAALLPAEGVPYGVDDTALAEFIRGATVLLNLSGRWRDRELWERIPVRVYVDLDPGFTQLWHEQGADVGLAGHTHHVTVGASLARPGTLVPLAGVAWQPILPPVFLDGWPFCPPPATVELTTVANWRSYGSIQHGGVHFGQKAHAFRALRGLPAATDVPITIALSIHAGDEADRLQLVDAGWRLVDPVAAAGDPDRYQRFVQSSWAELGVAKTGYVAGRTGWMSDRSACYLASGRPVVVQDTGLQDALPIGDGLVTFACVDDAAEAIDRVGRDYLRHAANARRLAETYLDSRRVLGELVDWVLE